MFCILDLKHEPHLNSLYPATMDCEGYEVLDEPGENRPHVVRIRRTELDALQYEAEDWAPEMITRKPCIIHRDGDSLRFPSYSFVPQHRHRTPSP